MKIKFPVLVRYPRQLDTLFRHLDSKGLHWRNGLRLVDDKITINTPAWIFYDKIGISYYEIDTADKREFDINYVSYCCGYIPMEVEI